MALTKEQLKNLTPGDSLVINGTVNKINEDGHILATCGGSSVWLDNPDKLSLPSEHGTSVPTPKYDPCRLFRKGDKVRVVEWNGRHFHDRDYGVDIETGCVARIHDSEKDDPKKCAVKVAYRHYLFTVPTCFLELVTPVEELEPYYAEEQYYCYIVGKRQEDPETEYIAGFSKTRHPNAKAAAEAECARLNEEWRKEQQ